MENNNVQNNTVGNNENKKSNLGILIGVIVAIVVILLVILFLLKGKTPTNGGSGGNTPTHANTEYDYKNGVLYTMVDENKKPKQTNFTLNGLFLIGNQHTYEDVGETEQVVDHFAKQGFKTEGINSSFYLNEHIEFYLDTNYSGNDMDVKIYIVPHHTVEEYAKMDFDKLNALAASKGTIMDYMKPDASNHNYVNEGYVNGDYAAGKYDILFIYNYEIVYFINVDVLKNE